MDKNQDMLDALLYSMQELSNRKETENGAIGYNTTNHPLLDLHFAISSMRDKDKRKLLLDNYFIYLKDHPGEISDFVAWAFYVRDIRQGIGERDLFRDILIRLAKADELDIAKRMKLLIELVSEYGRFDDLLPLLDKDIPEDIRIAVAYYLKSILVKDLALCANDRFNEVSLCAKWMPSIKTSSKLTMKRAKEFCDIIEWNYSAYRKILSKLREVINIVERNLSAKEYENITYQHVPSKAMLKYREAFKRNDSERFSQYLEDVKSGKAKMNMNVTQPHEIFADVLENDETNDPMLIEAWKALPKLELTKGFIPIIDASYSMTVRIPDSKYRAMHVALGLGSYLAYNNPSPVFNHRVLTFSKHPKLVELPVTGDNPYDIAKIYHANSDFMGLNTDIYRAFMLVLNAAVKANIPNNQIPDILILSDMEFDDNERYRKYFVDEEDDDKSILMDDIANKYKDKGYSLPRCIWWNLNSRSMSIPQIKNENGIIMLSGFSQNALKMIESDELDPYKVLLETIHSERYQPILEIMK